MREVLYRGKRIDNGEWVYGGVCQSETWTEILSVKDIAGDSYTPDTSEIIEYEVVPETVGQYIGLCDVSGVKVFEGDIVEVYTEDERAQVVFDQESARYNLEFSTFVADFDSYYTSEIEVVGNVYDNPELKN